MTQIILLFKSLLITAGIWAGDGVMAYSDGISSISYQENVDGSYLVVSHKCNLDSCNKCREIGYRNAYPIVSGPSVTFYAFNGQKIVSIRPGAIDIHTKFDQ